LVILKDYYEILGVQREATDTQIKTAYRKLVVMYHPDRNSDPSAETKIRDINEAYDVLSSPENRRKYDSGLYEVDWERVWKPQPPRHRDPAYRRERRPPPRPAGPDINDLIQKYHPLAVRVSMATLFFCGLMVIDMLLPSRTSVEKIIAVEYGSYYKRGDGEEQIGVWLLTNYNNRYRFVSTDPLQYDVDVLVSVNKSRLLGVTRRLSTVDHAGDRFRTTLYANFIFLPIVLMITSVLGVFVRDQQNLQYSLGVVNFFILILCIVLLFLF
jgi:hypothetical protein